MRGSSLLVVMLLGTAACHGAKQTGPAWPAPSTTADDGGESIDPRATTIAAAIEKPDEKDDAPAAPAAEAAKPAATPEADKPAAAPAATQAPEGDVIMSEEIIIEIDD